MKDKYFKQFITMIDRWTDHINTWSQIHYAIANDWKAAAEHIDLGNKKDETQEQHNDPRS